MERFSWPERKRKQTTFASRGKKGAAPADKGAVEKLFQLRDWRKKCGKKKKGLTKIESNSKDGQEQPASSTLTCTTLEGATCFPQTTMKGFACAETKMNTNSE